MSFKTILICEGYATGASIAKSASEALVLASMNAGNLSSVATGARLKWPRAEIVIYGDDDRHSSRNIGREKALEAARLVGGRAVFPAWPEAAPESLTDFNDLACYLAGSEDE